MTRDELRKLLIQLSESEMRHKKNPTSGLSIYEKVKKVRSNGEEVLLFDFDQDLYEMTQKNTKFPYNINNQYLNHQIAITQHSRYSLIPTHIHNYVEMTYVYKGECKQIINGKLLTLQEGDISILDTNVPHSVLETSENDIIINFIMLKSFFTTAFLSRLGSTGIISNFLINAISQTQDHNRFIVFHTGIESIFKETVENLMCEYFEPDICSKEIIESYIVILFSEMLRTFQRNQAMLHGSSSENNLIQILKYLEDNYKDCTLISTANYFNFHPNYFSSFIKKSTGRTFKELIQIQRMTRACILLTNTSLTVNEIANEVGYQNLGFFYKKFTSYFKQTPSEFRKGNLQ
ncbi:MULTISPECIES: AraC family transcriptional regulator [Niallia]|uniref:AraC family transcriptional regulator n=1 Tax=Niallia TaxID=2837506 RepID=UPI001EDC0241|nr:MULTISPECIES: AraC family transcriptional regulator [Niallia]MED4040091.1 AraC family transcriptional regulator [Niallia taxi]UPO91100.1 AraC family transcriptional regulator [Niallia sp. Man26]